MSDTPTVTPTDATWDPEQSRQNWEKLDKLGIDLNSVEDLVENPPPPIRWRVEGLLARGSFSIFSAPPKAGKSTVVRNLARCVVDGVPFLGRACDPANVLYFGLEDHASGVYEHIRRMGTKNIDRLFVLSNIAAEYTAKERWDILRLAIGATMAELVIIDTYWTFMEPDDMNDYSEINKGFKRIRDYVHDVDIHMVFTHHSGKQNHNSTAHNSLGSSGMTGNPETCFYIAYNEARNQRKINSINRWGVAVQPPIPIVMDERGIITSEYRDDPDSFDAECQSNHILRRVKQKPGHWTRATLLKELGGNALTFHKNVTKLLAEGKIRITGKGMKGDPALLWPKESVPENDGIDNEESDNS